MRRKLVILIGAALLCVPAMNAAPERAEQTPAQNAPFNQQQALEALRKQIAGKEQQPADTVFKNITMFKNSPAGRVLAVMETGFSRSLGIDCTHCHIPGEWEKEDKPTKQIAREMMTMTGQINRELLKKIKNLKSENPGVNCTTCHRGQIKPALNIN
jgi:hypothetical protein